jgi:hypothetical protein
VGRRERFGGSYTIHHAEELFWQSVAAGSPDYTFVALAIGASPAAPPSWAVWACIDARQNTERQTARGPDKITPPILDELVRHLARRQWSFESRDRSDAEPDAEYRPPSFRSAVIEVAEADPNWRDKVSGADSDWYKPIVRAWNWEQQNDLARSTFWTLEGFKTTARIDRVMTQTVAAEVGDPDDVDVWTWVAKRASDLL